MEALSADQTVTREAMPGMVSLQVAEEGASVAVAQEDAALQTTAEEVEVSSAHRAVTREPMLLLLETLVVLISAAVDQAGVGHQITVPGVAD